MFKFLLIAILLAVAFATSPDFERWMIKYNKSYESLAEKEHRHAVYRHNMARFAEMSRKSSAVYGENEFSDLTVEEFSQTRLGGIPMSPEALARSCLTSGVTLDLDMEAPRLPTAPTSFDWAAQGKVTPVKNQGQCGSCWTFSTTGVIESAWAIAGNTLVGLSEQELVDCSHGCTNEPPYGKVCNSGCNGGWPWIAMSDIMTTYAGLESEKDYPYDAETGTCHYTASDVVAKISNYTCLTSPAQKQGANEATMKSFLAANGPLSIALDASPLMGYTGGIVSGTDCETTSLDHAVLITGYGSEGGKDYWIVKNSWGKTWGKAGYFWIERGTGACGLNNAVTFPVVQKK